MHHQQISERVGTIMASIGAWITAYVSSDVIFNEVVRLLSSSIIAACGAYIGYKVTKYLKDQDSKNK